MVESVDADSQGPLKTCPPELVSIIFDFVGTCDCLVPCKCVPSTRLVNAFNLRLACKDLADIGARNIFKTIYLSFRKKSFENLENVSKHPVLRKYVKCITYEGDGLGDMQRQEWERCIPIPRSLTFFSNPEFLPHVRMADLDRNDFASGFRRLNAFRTAQWKRRIYAHPRLYYTEEELDEGFKCFKKEISDNSDLLENDGPDGFDYTTLREAMKNFPNLEEVNNFMGAAPHANSEHLRATFKDTLIFPHILATQYGRNQDIRNLKPWAYSQCFRQVESMLLAVISAGIKLKSMRCGHIWWRFFSDEEVNEVGIYPALFLPAFKNLTHLELSLDKYSEDANVDNIVSSLKASHLGEALAHAQGLISLDLCFGAWPLDYGIQRLLTSKSQLKTFSASATWDYIAGETVWPHLEKLSLASAGTSEEFFVDFIQRHSKTLVSLKLGRMFMINKGSWDSTFHGLKAVLEKSSKLETAEFHHCFFHFQIETGTDPVDENLVLNMDHSSSDGHSFGSKLSNYLVHNGEDPFKLIDAKDDAKDDAEDDASDHTPTSNPYVDNYDLLDHLDLDILDDSSSEYEYHTMQDFIDSDHESDDDEYQHDFSDDDDSEHDDSEYDEDNEDGIEEENEEEDPEQD